MEYTTQPRESFSPLCQNRGPVVQRKGDFRDGGEASKDQLKIAFEADSHRPTSARGKDSLSCRRVCLRSFADVPQNAIDQLAGKPESRLGSQFLEKRGEGGHQSEVLR